MPEGMSRFRIKRGEAEIEYEGCSEDVNDKYKEAFEWLKSAPLKGSKKDLEGVKGKEQGGKRGGAQKALFAPKIDELIREDYFKLPNKRKISDVLRALMEKGLPVTGKDDAVLIALKRRLGKTLKGTKEKDEWVFWTE